VAALGGVRAQRCPRRQRGLSLVELMVGLSVGLLVLAGAAVLFAQQLHAARRSAVEARLQQDLRAAADLLVRDVRRAAHWNDALQGVTWPPQQNPFGHWQLDRAAVHYQHQRASIEDELASAAAGPALGASGFRVQQQVLSTRAGSGRWQALTDRALLRVTQVELTDERRVASAPGACAQAEVRVLHYALEAHAVPPHQQVRHRVQGSVQLPNARVEHNGCTP
jgi:prepilin peptidase dependent protein B